MLRKKSLRTAINLKCKDCNYDELDKGTWRQQVESCTSSDCPLYEHRPKSYPVTSKIIPKWLDPEDVSNSEGDGRSNSVCTPNSVHIGMKKESSNITK